MQRTRPVNLRNMVASAIQHALLRVKLCVVKLLLLEVTMQQRILFCIVLGRPEKIIIIFAKGKILFIILFCTQKIYQQSKYKLMQ